MKQQCCTCGKTIRFSALLGNEGLRLSDGYACFSCCKKAGYGKGLIASMKLVLISQEEFILKYNSALSSKKSKFSRFEDKPVEIDYSNFSDSLLESEIKKYIVVNPGIMLDTDEVCYFCVPCHSIRFKNVVVGTNTTSAHIGGSKKGIYLGNGYSSKVNDRKNVAEKYQGHFFLTNKRMICNALKYSFEIPLTNITSLTTYSDGLTVMSKGVSYNVSFEGISRFKNLVNLNNEIEERRKKIEKERKVINNNHHNLKFEKNNIPDLIREYKKLMDDGIITQEEFDAKKKELLGL